MQTLETRPSIAVFWFTSSTPSGEQNDTRAHVSKGKNGVTRE